MGITQHGARLSPRDVSDLNDASENLAAVATLIQRNRPSYGDAAIRLLVEANNTVVRIQNKGAAAFARHLEREQKKQGPGAPEGDPGDATAELEDQSSSAEG